MFNFLFRPKPRNVNVRPTFKFIPNQRREINDDKESEILSLAQSPLESKHEARAIRAGELVKSIENHHIPSDPQILSLDRSVPKEQETMGELRKLGRELGAEGGHWLMVLISQRAVAISKVSIRFFEVYWQEICDWAP